MHGQTLHRSRPVVAGLIAALAIGLTLVAVGNTVLAMAGTHAIGALWDDQSPAQVCLASLPYLILAACRIFARRAWITGLCLTTTLWGYYLWAITHYQGGGANIGLGILMLVSPVPITGASLFAYMAFADGRKRAG